MLSTIVVTPSAAADATGRAGAFLRTLAALVPAAVEGVVRDVTLLQVGDAASLAGIADEAGCHVVEERDFPAALARGVAGARGPWIFVVKAGTVPSRLFGEETARALDGGLEVGTALLLREQPTSLLARWFPSLAPSLASSCRATGSPARPATASPMWSAAPTPPARCRRPPSPGFEIQVSPPLIPACAGTSGRGATRRNRPQSR